jgi:hypothetical protein
VEDVVRGYERKNFRQAALEVGRILAPGTAIERTTDVKSKKQLIRGPINTATRSPFFSPPPTPFEHSNA